MFWILYQQQKDHRTDHASHMMIQTPSGQITQVLCNTQIRNKHVGKWKLTFSNHGMESRSPFTRKGPNGKSYPELPMPDSDISYVSSGRPSIDRIFPTFYDAFDSGKATPPRTSNSTEIDMNHSFESMNYFGRKSLDISSSPPAFSSISQESDRLSSASQPMMVSVSCHISAKCVSCVVWKTPSIQILCYNRDGFSFTNQNYRMMWRLKWGG